MILLLGGAIFLQFCSLTRQPKIEPTREVERKPGNAAGGEGIFQTGTASWYGKDFHGKRTANGEVYDMNKLTAAHRELPFNSILEVKNLENGKTVIVRINDRGPFVEGRIIDLSYEAARRIGCTEPGTAQVNIKLIKSSELKRGTGAYRGDGGSGYEIKTDCCIQAGAFSSEKNARKMLLRLAEAVPQLSFKIEFQEGLYKVVSETFLSRPRAEEFKTILEDYGIEVFIKEK